MDILPNGRALIMGADFVFVLLVAPHLHLCRRHLNHPLVYMLGMQEHNIDIIRFRLGTSLPVPERALELLREAEIARKPDGEALMVRGRHRGGPLH